ncbi:MAG: hypothetical protein NTX50_21160 [Candidatus Sumerlaeota bacterium]|nr:hypothetical protein [Candidatus Sumerlaeota bacterium]
MPETSQVHIDAALTNVSVAYRNADVIADLIAPAVSVRKQSDKYFIHDAEREKFRASDDRRAPGSEANAVDYALTSDSYFCEDHALESVIPDEERENSDPAIQVDIDRTEFLTSKIELNREIELADAIHNSADIPGDTLSGDNQWDDPDSDPVAAVEAQKATILAAASVMPNTLVLPYQVYAAVRMHPKVVERIQYVRMGIATPNVLAELFDVERLLVPRAQKNTAAEGQTASMSYVWGKDALLCYTPPRPGLKTVSLAYTFLWTAAPGSVAGRIVEVWREDRRKADVLRVQKYYDHKLIAAGAGYLWKSAVA